MSKGLWQASVDGTTGLVAQAAGRLRDGASDLFGRVWVRLHDGTSPISSTNPLPVTGAGGALPNQWSTFRTTAAGGEVSRVVKASSGRLRDVYVFNNSNGVAYLMLFDATALPANGTVPLIPSVKVFNDSNGFYDFGEDGLNFGTGMTVALSTTPLSLTAIAGGGAYGGRFA